MEAKSKKLIIFGAKSIALGAYLAIKELYPEYDVIGFMVSKMDGNTDTLCELPVREINCYTDKNIHILIATPEDIQHDIFEMLSKQKFHNVSCLDSKKESALMKRYYEKIGKFPRLKETFTEVYMAKFYRDKPLKNNYAIPGWVIPIQVGASLTDVRVAELTDNIGENISDKNPNYCELTALYWLWKNRLCADGEAEYYGLFHYRRFLDVSDDDLVRMKRENVDVILPYPTVHEPDISEHHSRYIKEDDWNAMLCALEEQQPKYAQAFKEIIKQPYLYNYNILIAKKKVLKNYCEWLFPILERTEELSNPRGCDRADRYIGYMGENLLTLYFMVNKNKVVIRHSGRLMYI